MTDLKVVTLYETNLRDPASTLRIIADEIASGKFGEVSCVGLTLMGDKLEIFGMGPESDSPQVAMLFQAAIQRFAKTIEEYGK